MEKNILACIPARGGSKRIPQKNIKELNGKPLIAYSIEAALSSKFINKVIVSTDDQEIAEIAKKYRAEVPFLRPAELAQDGSPTLSVLEHAVNYLEKEENYSADLVVILQPTSPLRTAEDIDEAIEKIEVTKTNCCVSLCGIHERPEWLYKIENNKVEPFLSHISFEERSKPSQFLPKVFKLNGAVCIIRKKVLMENHKVIDEKSLSAIIMPQERSVDIDEPLDFELAKLLLEKTNAKNL